MLYYLTTFLIVTLMMAQRHNCSIALEVFQTKFVTTKAGTEAYCREIALKNSFGREVVYALARVHLDLFSPEARADIRAESLPLGRILVKHNVERRLEVDGVYLLEKPSEWLSSRWQVEKDTSLYARTATILCNDQPAIEVLEIIRPEGTR